MAEGSHDDVLRASVGELVAAFRQGLIGFLPTAERLMMPWQDENQHRDWERVAEAMFDACVRSPIGADEGRSAGEYKLARYDIDVEAYDELSWISVRHPSYDVSLAMIRLMSRRDPFDTVEAAVVDAVSLARSGSVELPFDEVEFAYLRRVVGAAPQEAVDIVAVE